MYERIRALLSSPAADVLLAAAFSLASVLAGHTSAWGLLITVPLVWRRQQPVLVVLIQFASILAIHNIGLVEFVAALAGAYALAAHGPRPLISLAILVGMAGIVALSFSDTSPPIPNWVTPFAFLVPIGLFGTTIRTARARADASAQRAAALEHEQEAATRAAVAEVRARIARDLHDVVSHHVSVMVIQAGAAGKVLDERPDLARGAVAAIEASGREAMADLRHLLGLLNPTADGSAPLQPLPGLDQLDALVANVRAAGQPVTVSRSGADPPYWVGQVAYRVVQEALTNALRYAPGATTEVTISATDSSLVVEVTNAASEVVVPEPPPEQGSGSGLLGLAERVRLYRGTFEAGRRPLGGFRVRAVLPVEQS